MNFNWMQWLLITSVSFSIALARPHKSLDRSKIDQSIISDDQQSQKLFRCDPCLPGWGVKSFCNNTSNTICTPCPLGSWSPKRSHFRQCTPCSKCGDGLYEDIPCAITRDTKCDSCANVKGHFNEDYKRKCDWRQVPESLKTDEEEIDDQEDYEDDQDYVQPGSLINFRIDQIRKNSNSNKIAKGEIVELKTDSSDEDDFEDFEEGKDVRANLPDLDMLRSIMRKQALDAMKDMNQKFQRKSEEDAGDSNEGDQSPRPFALSRPMAQTMPVKRVVFVNAPLDDSWEEESVQNQEKQIQVNYPPSYHQYPIESLMHNQRRKAFILIGLTSCVVVVAVIFIICFVRVQHSRKTYNPVAVVNLSAEDKEIVRQSANRLETTTTVKRFQFGAANGYKSLVNSQSSSSLAITENPLEAYLDCYSDPKKDEPRVEDEGENAKREKIDVV